MFRNRISSFGTPWADAGHADDPTIGRGFVALPLPSAPSTVQQTASAQQEIYRLAILQARMNLAMDGSQWNGFDI